MKMEKIMLEDYIILCIENKKVRIIYDAGNTDLYLWKYGSFYLSRDWLSIIPNCPKENIILIDRNKGILQCCNKKLLEKVCTLSKKSLEKVYILSKSRLKKFVISYITPLKK